MCCQQLRSRRLSSASSISIGIGVDPFAVCFKVGHGNAKSNIAEVLAAAFCERQPDLTVSNDWHKTARYFLPGRLVDVIAWRFFRVRLENFSHTTEGTENEKC